MEGGGGGLAHAADGSGGGNATSTTTSLFGRLRLALSRRTSSTSNPGGSTKQTPLGSIKASTAADFLGTSSRGKSTSMTSSTTTLSTATTNAGLSLSQLLMEKRPHDPWIPLPETGKGSRPDGGIEFGYSLSRGRRLAMEDFHAAGFETHPSVPGKETVGTFGVFDGHGGDRAAAFVSRELFRSILTSEEFASGDAAGALTAGFLATDRAYLRAENENESLAAAAEETAAAESAKKKKVFSKVKSIFIKGGAAARNGGSGDINGGNDFGLSPPSSSTSAALTNAPSSVSSGEGIRGQPGGVEMNGKGGGASTATTAATATGAAAAASPSSSSISPPLTPTEAPSDPARSTSGTAGVISSPLPAPFLTPSPSRQRLPPPPDDGCTATVALVLGDERLLIAHVGDSRAVLVEPAAAAAAVDDKKKRDAGDRSPRGRGGGGKRNEQDANSSSSSPSPPAQTPVPQFTARALSTDHKPNRPDERARIEAAGGTVLWAGTWRVGGVLAVSRAFGDSALKLTSGVVADPDVREEKLTPPPPPPPSPSRSRGASAPFAPLLILATDGVWDALTADEAAAVALAHACDLEAAAKALTSEAWERGSADNATAVVVRLGPGPKPMA